MIDIIPFLTINHLCVLENMEYNLVDQKISVDQAFYHNCHH